LGGLYSNTSGIAIDLTFSLFRCKLMIILTMRGV
jgi:hypothetical protein